MLFTIFQESRKGSRKMNQDRVAHSYSRDSLIMVAADGMGGHAGGEIAAQITVRILIERFQHEAKPLIKNPLLFLHDTMMRAHAALGHYAEQFSLIETPRTTCVACVIQEDKAHWAHVGDSRLYMFRRAQLVAQTKDHSKVQYLLDQGAIQPEQAAKHPDRNKIFSCLGGFADPAIDVSKKIPIRVGDIILLCTDGLWCEFNATELARGLTYMPLLSAAPLLLDEAERRGSVESDNLSLLAMRWGAEDARDDAPPSKRSDTLSDGEFSTQMDHALTLTDPKVNNRDLTDEEIERAIDEIQSTIKRYGGK
ncbi:MAG: protein phosphatase 2C domain-containing protein [Betaproteobacteria bacterium]